MATSPQPRENRASILGWIISVIVFLIIMGILLWTSWDSVGRIIEMIW